MLVCIGCASQKAREPDGSRPVRNEFTDSVANEWNKFLAENFKPGLTEAEVEKLMSGRFRDHGLRPGVGSGRFIIQYLVDDYHEIGFHFDHTGKLTGTSVFQRGSWLKHPDGHISIDP